MKRTKRKLNVKNVVIFSVLLVLLLSCVGFGINKLFFSSGNAIIKKDVSKYLASNTNNFI